MPYALWSCLHDATLLDLLLLDLPYLIMLDVFFTSSTAQGGGGSFKNRKPIGEIGCCELPVVPHKAVAEVSKIGNL